MIWGSRRPRPFGWYVARTLVPRTVLFLALAAALLVGQALAVDPLAAPASVEPAALPAWTDADAVANPGCVPSSFWHTGTPAAAVVVYGPADTRGVRMAFDTAWALNHDASETNDVWVVGVCP